MAPGDEGSSAAVVAIAAAAAQRNGRRDILISVCGGRAGMAGLGTECARAARQAEVRGRDARADQRIGAASAPCSRPISVFRNMRLKRSWQDAETCSSSVALTFSTVTGLDARMLAVRRAPFT